MFAQGNECEFRLLQAACANEPAGIVTEQNYSVAVEIDFYFLSQRVGDSTDNHARDKVGIAL